MKNLHIPVLLDEVIEYLQPNKNQNFIDLTIGAGGHAEAILNQTAPSGEIIGLDLDQNAVKIASERLRGNKDRVHLFHENFKNITKIKNEQFPDLSIDGILLDLGLSSFALEDESRGFSFLKDGPLDMRFDRHSPGQTAADILNHYPFDKLSKIIKEYGEDKFHKFIALKIIQMREKNKFKKTNDLVDAVLQTYRERLGSKKEVPFIKGNIHPATRTFQALRIEVNREMDNLKQALPDCLKILKRGGRIAVIAFNSLEDRIVKHFFKMESKDCLCPKEMPTCQCGHEKIINIITKKPVTPKVGEIKSNPRARSAKMRVAIKIK